MTYMKLIPGTDWVGSVGPGDQSVSVIKHSVRIRIYRVGIWMRSTASSVSNWSWNLKFQSAQLLPHEFCNKQFSRETKPFAKQNFWFTPVSKLTSQSFSQL